MPDKSGWNMMANQIKELNAQKHSAEIDHGGAGGGAEATANLVHHDAHSGAFTVVFVTSSGPAADQRQQQLQHHAHANHS